MLSMMLWSIKTSTGQRPQENTGPDALEHQDQHGPTTAIRNLFGMCWFFDALVLWSIKMPQSISGTG